MMTGKLAANNGSNKKFPHANHKVLQKVSIHSKTRDSTKSPLSANYFYKQPQISTPKGLRISSVVVPFPPSTNFLKNLGTSLAFPSLILYPRSAFNASNLE